MPETTTTVRPEFTVSFKEESAVVFNDSGKLSGIDSAKIIWSENLLYIPLYLEDCGCSNTGRPSNSFAASHPATIMKIRTLVESIISNRNITDQELEVSNKYSGLLNGIWFELEPEKPATLVWQNLTASDTIDMPYGGSLNKTLSMTNAQALEFAKRFKKDYRYTDDGRLFVKVSPGLYVKDWRPIEVSKVSWGMLVGEYMSSAPK
ncbi:MAG: hypothetical protein QG583_772 [Patescibacteria group bacterium]|nr:hypothetical protein [Patescibacteria group bacterium]